MSANLNFGELSNDSDLQKRVNDFHESLEKAGDMLETFCSLDVYDKLSNEDKAR